MDSTNEETLKEMSIRSFQAQVVFNLILLLKRAPGHCIIVLHQLKCRLRYVGIFRSIFRQEYTRFICHSVIRFQEGILVDRAHHIILFNFHLCFLTPLESLEAFICLMLGFHVFKLSLGLRSHIFQTSTYALYRRLPWRLESE